MALSLSATDVAIAVAAAGGTLRVYAFQSPRGLGEAGIIADEVGVIEAHLSLAEAEARVAAVKAQAGVA